MQLEYKGCMVNETIYLVLFLLQIYDAIIIAASFTMDLVFLGGVAGEEGQKAVGILVILLLWRIARVIDGKKGASIRSTTDRQIRRGTSSYMALSRQLMY